MVKISVPAVPNESYESEMTNMEPPRNEFRSLLKKSIIDAILLALIIVAMLSIIFYVEPYKSGFFCDDESLMYPVKEAIVENYVLYFVGFAVPLLVIVIAEFVNRQSTMRDEREVIAFGRKIPAWVQNLYKYFGLFLFGAACSQLAAEIGKHAIGRLRPHFIAACQPILPDGSTCSDSKNLHHYIETFTCSNQDSKDLWLSFPSAHSCFAVYSMLFAALYIHFRMNWKGSKLFKHVLQFIFMLMALLFVSSRIADHKHHWSDAWAGSLLGIVICVITVFGVSDLSKYNVYRIVK